MLWLSWTAAKRYERCGELQRQWKAHEVAEETDQKKFFAGRVVHSCFEQWMTNDVDPLDVLPKVWHAEEAPLLHNRYALRWLEGERDATYAKCEILVRKLKADAAGFLRWPREAEIKQRAVLLDDVGLYAQLDLLAWPREDVAYLVELKSGTSYEPEQVDWYAAVISLARRAEGLPAVNMVGVSLRPAMEESVAARLITPEAMAKQLGRAHAIGTAMLRDEWPAIPQGFCSQCEGRNRCPDYQAKFGNVRSGRVSYNAA